MLGLRVISRLNLRTKIACIRDSLEKKIMRSEPSAVDVVCVTKETTTLFLRNLIIVVNYKATSGSKPALKITFYKSCLFPSTPFRCVRKSYRANMIGRGLMG